MDTILLTGQTGLFSKEILQYIGETAQVFVTGQKSAGAMKVLRVLPDEEAAAICWASGYDPLPRKHPFSPAVFGL